MYVIRERMQGWIAWAIVIILIVPFALWGIQEYFNEGGPQVVANINGEEIKQSAYTEALSQERGLMQQQLQQMRQIFGEQYEMPLSDEDIKKQAMEKLINSELLLQNASDMGLRISDVMVAGRIRSFEAFQEDGKFSPELFKNFASRQNGDFGQLVARDMLTQQMRNAVMNSALATPKDVDLMLRLQEQKRDVEYFTLTAAKHKQDSDATDEAVKAYYEAHKTEFMNPEKVSVEYVELSVADLGQAVEPNEEDLRGYYKDRMGQYHVPPERRTSHILISVDEGADEAKIKAAKVKAEDIRKQLLNGAKFEDLAKKHSDDPGSSKLGGDIGFFGKGNLDPNYEKVMFEMKKGDLSEPVLSSFGFHIIKLTDVREEQTKPFEAVKAELAAEYKKDQANKKYFEMTDKLTTLAYEVNDSLQDAAAAVGLPIKESPLFTRSGIPSDKIFSHPKVLKAAFQDEVLTQRYNSDPVEIGEHHVVVLRIKAHEEKSQRSYEEAKASAKQKLLVEKSKQNAKEKGEAAIKKLLAGETMDAMAKILSSEVKKEVGLKRTDRKIDMNIVKQAFKLIKPQADKKSYDGLVLPNGDYVVMAVTKVEEADLTAMDAAKKTNTRRSLTNVAGDTEFGTVLTSLKDRARILILEENL